MRLPDNLECLELFLNLLSKLVLSFALKKHLVVLEYFLASVVPEEIEIVHFELVILLTIQESKINNVNEQNNV